MAKTWPSTLTTVQPMSTGAVRPSAILDWAVRRTGTPSFSSRYLGTAVKVDPVSTITSRSSICSPCWFPTPMVTVSFPTLILLLPGLGTLSSFLTLLRSPP